MIVEVVERRGVSLDWALFDYARGGARSREVEDCGIGRGGGGATYARKVEWMDVMLRSWGVNVWTAQRHGAAIRARYRTVTVYQKGGPAPGGGGKGKDRKKSKHAMPRSHFRRSANSSFAEKTR